VSDRERGSTKLFDGCLEGCGVDDAYGVAGLFLIIKFIKRLFLLLV